MIYESHSAVWVKKFTNLATELECALAVHCAWSVNASNDNLDEQTTKNIEATMMVIFKSIEGPREREVSKHIDENVQRKRKGLYRRRRSPKSLHIMPPHPANASRT